ncbi:MAG TPA: 4-alpha-glucanotransferase [Gammaproteobacteria bacterium]|nr:4-alpha-glucanotransferase [Gammaproteobacteria bacterium]
MTLADERRAGILLHITSLPGGIGNGDLGPEAYRFVEFLAASAVSVWQVLPLGPTHDDGSPYQCLSVHAGNPLLISLEWLQDKGWLEPSQKNPIESSIDYRMDRLQQAWEGFQQRATEQELQELHDFVSRHAEWLDDFSLYMALRQELGEQAWPQWPEALRDRQPKALGQARVRLKNVVDSICFQQYLFFQQWHELRDYARQNGVLLFGDMPIFVAHDSAEVWAHREYFTVDEHGDALTVAGVPPDYFSATGQLWGNPLYRWERMQQDGFAWWIGRMRTQLELFDFVRIDHFRGFEACWEIPGNAETAVEGHWVKAPGDALLGALYEAFHALPLVAEDLGVITPEVDALRNKFGLPGMKILQFAFGGDASNPYLPHNHEKKSVVYTGTHDNDTTLGWYATLTEAEKGHISAYLGHPGEEMPWPLIRAALASVACLAMLPMQDVLELDGEYRMNTPGTTEGNWRWRFVWEQVNPGLSSHLSSLVHLYGRG